MNLNESKKRGKRNIYPDLTDVVERERLKQIILQPFPRHIYTKERLLTPTQKEPLPHDTSTCFIKSAE